MRPELMPANLITSCARHASSAAGRPDLLAPFTSLCSSLRGSTLD